MPFAAVRESVGGTKRTSGNVRPMSAFSGEADTRRKAATSGFDPNRKSALVQQQPVML
jgi:hypothetical protein